MDLGPRVRSSDLPAHVNRRLLDMFSRLEQTVMWRLEGHLEPLPHNVKVVERAPSLGVLCKIIADITLVSLEILLHLGKKYPVSSCLSALCIFIVFSRAV
jgi:hypothetical protein